jgi:8-oxo-dGTP pyrophosphatase MutT (NUDIX family)
LPAGKVELNESMGSAMRREIFEETGLDIPEASLVYFDTKYVRHEGRDFTYHTFSTKLTERPNIILSPSEHQAFKWVSPHKSLSMNLIFDLDECTRLFYGM